MMLLSPYIILKAGVVAVEIRPVSSLCVLLPELRADAGWQVQRFSLSNLDLHNALLEDPPPAFVMRVCRTGSLRPAREAEHSPPAESWGAAYDGRGHGEYPSPATHGLLTDCLPSPPGTSRTSTSRSQPVWATLRLLASNAPSAAIRLCMFCSLSCHIGALHLHAQI